MNEADDHTHTGLRQRETKDSSDDDYPESDPETSPSWWIERPLYFVLPYLHMKRLVRALYLVAVPLFLSMLRVENEFYHIEFLTGRKSFLNVFFVKLGWGWTFSVILFLRLCCLPLHSNWKNHLGNLLLRLSILTSFFYILCQVLFPSIEEWTGRCVKQGIVSNVTNMTKRRCLKMKDHEFYAVDISGHSFLMSYCILALIEESKELIYVLCLGQLLRKSGQTVSSDNKTSVVTSLSPEELKVLEKIYLITVPFIVLATLIAFCVSIIWDVMLIVTTLYYHVFIEKALGICIGISSWYFQYIVLYPTFDIL